MRRQRPQPHHLNNQPPELLARTAGYRLIAGVDEAGRGPWAGPVVAAAVILPLDNFNPAGIRIDDSKRLTSLQRDRAFDVILRQAHVGIGVASAEEIDRDNILQAVLLAMQRAIRDLPVQPELVMVDGSVSPSLDMPCWPVIHGDALSRVIACASIVAKVTRDRLMWFYHRMLPQYAFDEHKGYGTTRHRLALAEWGPSFLHRLTFHPVSRTTLPAGGSSSGD